MYMRRQLSSYDILKRLMGQQTPPANKSAILLLLGDIADTTWRMFVPTIGGALGGMWLDDRFGLAPWCAIGGLMIGVGITAVLIRQQYKKIQ